MALTALQVKNAKPGDKLTDGGGLRLDVDKNGNKSWVFRFKSPVTVSERYMGLGPAADVTLAQARDAAQNARAMLRSGVDPIEDRKKQRTDAKVQASRSITFKAYAEQFISGREAGWKNEKHRQQWRNSLRDYAYPMLGHLPVSEVDTAAVLKVLRPVWSEKPETASRLRGRIEAILSAAKVEGLRQGDNPALWRGHISEVLPRKKDVRAVVHHPALPYEEMPRFWKSLATDTSDAARMLRFIILTACRYGEAKGMTPNEVKNNLWTVPKDRMKGDRDHFVPLVPLALAQLPFKPVSDVSLSKCIARHTNSPATTHGMRSTFRDWAGDETEAAWETMEAAIAHKVGDETEAAYRRRSALAKRWKLMEQWAGYCSDHLTNPIVER